MEIMVLDLQWISTPRYLHNPSPSCKYPSSHTLLLLSYQNHLVLLGVYSTLLPFPHSVPTSTQPGMVCGQHVLYLYTHADWVDETGQVEIRDDFSLFLPLFRLVILLYETIDFHATCRKLMFATLP